MKKTAPPPWADQLLESFCAPHLLEEVQGDLYELYGLWVEEHGSRKASWLYAWHAIKFFRPYALRKNTQHDTLNNNPDMFQNYLKVSIRNILKYKVFSFINVFGLAVAMSVCMLIILMLADQKSYDQFHTKKDRIYRIISEPKDAKANYATTPVPLAATLKSDYPIIETSTHLIQGLNGEAIHEQKLAEIKGYFADSLFFKVFSFALEKGNSITALNAPNAMVITDDLAEQLFRDEDPIGKTIEFMDRGQSTPVSWGLFTVTGVIANAYKSHLEFDVLVSAASLPSLYAEEKIDDLRDNWSSYSSAYTYALLYPGHSKEDLDVLLTPLAKQQIATLEEREGFHLSAQSLTGITPGPLLTNPSSISLPMMAYYILAGLALVIMLSACLNYTNLSVARALTRAKEIGVRKVTGARRKDLMYQFLSESMIMSLLALALAILLLIVLKPAFMSLWLNQYLNFDLQENLSVYLLFLGFALLIGFMAGVYPALHLSGYKPIKVLKHLDNMQPGKLGLRKILSSTQFVISLFFIVTSLLIYKQFKHYLAFDYGFSSTQVVNVPLQGNPYKLVANELNSVAGVAAISASEYIPATGYNNGAELRKAGSEDEFTYFISLPVDENFVNTLGIQLIAGRHLPDDGTSSERFALVNASAVKALGYEHPSEIIGLVLDSKWSDTDLEVIGVVENFRVDLPSANSEVRPLILQNHADAFKYVNVKIASGDLKGTLASLEGKWKGIDPVHPFKYEFYDEQLASTHQAIFDLVAIVGFIGFLAITIACLGMLGMATYTAERRIKEVGIRKVLGAENLSVALLLSKSFLKILFISIGIAAPLIYFFNNFWLQYIPNRVDFSLDTVLIGSFVLLILGLITISSQTLRVARRNPVDTLRNE